MISYTNYYKIINNTLGQRIAVYFPDGKFKQWVESNIPTEDSRIPKIAENTQELEEIIKSCIDKGEEPNPLEFGQTDDFLPIAHLRKVMAKGLRCSSSVCRLVRNYSSEDSDIQELLETVKRCIRFGKTREEISQLLSLTDINSIFWEEYSQISEEPDNKFAEQLLNKLKAKSQFLEQLKKRIEKVPIGTGFLVGQNYLLTNNHILESKAIAGKFTAEFLYEQDALGGNLQTVEYKLDVEHFFQKNLDTELDYALVKLKALSETERTGYNLIFHEAGDNFGWLSMLEENRIIAPPYNLPNRKKSKTKEIQYDSDQYREFGIYYDVPGDPVIIIQHPRGRRKEIVIFNNRVQKIYKDFLQYETATDFGSSGGPALNRKWQLISLHHATLIDIDNQQKVGHLGVRINKIIGDLKQAIENFSGEEPNKIQDFIDKFVVLKNRKYQRGRIFIVANYVNIYKGEEPRQSVELICERIISTFQEKDKDGFRVIKVPNNLDSMQKVIKHIENDYCGYKVGDIALQIYISERNAEKERGTTIFYVANKDERRLHAELLLQSLSNAVPELPSQGARSDNTTVMGKIDFCRDLRMPSLSMRLGFYKNEEDKKIINQKSESIAAVIAKGLIDWGDSLSPIPALSEFD